MTALWTTDAVAAATGGRVQGDWVASGISIDTRSIAPGDLFVALVGPNRDAHGFVPEALARGAAAALVSRPIEGVDPEALVVVADTQAALEALGRAGRARSRARIAGITGSVGKTGTKEALRHVLSRQAPTHASAASHNNHWGVPLSLARMPEGATYGVFEMGMNHAGEISVLTRLVRPHVALITKIAPAHLAFFASVEGIADAKGEIFEGLVPGGTAILNRDDAHYERLLRHARRGAPAAIVTFGEHPEADWRLVELSLASEHSDLVIRWRGHGIACRVGTAGRHWALNSLGVLAVAQALGADPEHAARSLADLRPPAGRGERHPFKVKGGEALLIDESYNANPVSVRAALALLGQMEGRRIAALGDMLELGERADALHADLAKTIAEVGVDLLFTCGRHMAHLHEAVPAALRGGHAPDSAALAVLVRDALRPGDVLLVKGSLGSRMARVVDAVTRPNASSAGR